MERETAVLPERIEGQDQLLLRQWTVDDAEALGQAIAESAEHLRPWMAWIAQEPEPIERRRARIREWERGWAAGGDVVLGVFLADRIVGGSGLHRRIARDGLEIGYWIHANYLRQGLATGAVRLMTDAALARPEISHVEIHHDKANTVSAWIPRKLGFQFVGEERDLPEAPADLGIEWRWRMNEETWRARKRSAHPGDRLLF
jgi:RimJ/RimL family protein N-acetyltransferase